MSCTTSSPPTTAGDFRLRSDKFAKPDNGPARRRKTCLVCKAPGGSKRPGSFYEAVGDNGMRLVNIWVCDACAVPLGPPQ